MNTRVLALVFVTVALSACQRARPNVAGPADRRPEPVAPAMTPGAAASAPSVTLPPATVSLPATGRDRVREIADSAIRAPLWKNARWGILIVDAASGDTILTHDADRLFMPASNQKLLTAAVAMQQLGPDFRWKTPVLLRGAQRGSTWNGDLLVQGSGDPSFSDTLRAGNAMSAFDPVVAALASKGIRRITGRVLAHGDAFTGSTTGFGWEIDDLDESYGAPVDELMFNEGELIVRVRAGTRTGVAPVVTTAPTRTYPRVVNRVTIRDASTSGESIRAVYDTTASAIVLTGTIAAGDSATFPMSYRHPADAATAALHEMLQTAGVSVGGRFIAVTPRDSATETLVTLESPPLATVVRRMQKPSQNQVAELLFRTSGLAVSGVGSADSARAVAARTLALWGVRTEDAAYRDGSGLSRHDYVSPRAIVRVLDAMRRSPWFDTYRSALPLAGVDGTLRNRMKGTPAAGNAQAKTGTVDKARSLSGYVTTADGRVVMFSLLANNFTVPTREVERVQDMIVVALATLQLGATTATGIR